MIDDGIIKILVELVDHGNNSIRVNCMWALMNSAFQADQETKQTIISSNYSKRLINPFFPILYFKTGDRAQ